MAVNRVPVLKRCRSLGMDPVYLGIDKKSNRQLKRSNRKMSEYGLQLREKQKAKFIYGVLEKPFLNYFKKADQMSGMTGENLMVLLESRLDNVVFRLGFARTRREARQIVDHKHVLVNGKQVNIPSYLIKAGDVITAIDGEDITDAELSDVVSMIKKKQDEDVVLTVQRQGEDTQEITVKVSDVELPSVFGEMLDENTGYIQITEFKGVTAQQYEETFADLKDQGMTRLIVDLRDNPGGLLNIVCDILRDILPEGLIVYTEDKNGNRSEETCDGKNPLDMSLAVLVNGNSASASEIFAGAVKDYGIGTIVGTTTYGKGVVQSIRQLSDGSAVKLTVANYYTPNGNSINKTGIEPDVEVELDASLVNETEISHDEDNQLQEALKVLNDKN